MTIIHRPETKSKVDSFTARRFFISVSKRHSPSFFALPFKASHCGSV